MTTTPIDPFATRTDDHAPEPQPESFSDEQAQHLRAENRALRALLAAQVQPYEAEQSPGRLRRFAWWLLSAPGAMVVGWRRLFGLAETAQPFSGKRAGYTALTVLYTLAIYGGLVLLVVYWSTPRYAAGDPSLLSASPVRVPLPPSHSSPSSDALAHFASQVEATGSADEATNTTPMGDVMRADLDSAKTDAPVPAKPAPMPVTTTLTLDATSTAQSAVANSVIPSSNNGAVSPGARTPALEKSGPRSTLRITEIPAVDPQAWVKELRSELSQCAALSFLGRPDCVARARKQFCEPNKAWGMVRDCPASPTP